MTLRTNFQRFNFPQQQLQGNVKTSKVEEESKTEEKTKTEEENVKNEEPANNTEQKTLSAKEARSLMLSGWLNNFQAQRLGQFGVKLNLPVKEDVTPESLYALQNEYRQAQDLSSQLFDIAEKCKELSNDEDKKSLINEYLSKYNITNVSVSEVLEAINGYNLDNDIEKDFWSIHLLADNIVSQKQQEIVDNYIKTHNLTEEQAAELKSALAEGKELGGIFGFTSEEMLKGLLDYNIEKSYAIFSN